LAGFPRLKSATRERKAAALWSLGVILAATAAPLARQDPAPPAAAPAPPPASSPQQAEPAATDPFKFDSAAGLISWVVKPQEAENFELVWSVIRSRLAASRQPELRAVRASLTLFKADTPGESDLTYFLVIDPASKGTSYSVSFLLYESGMFERPEAEELFGTLQKATVRVVAVPVEPVKVDAPPVGAPPVSAGTSTVEPPAGPR